jgi:hypothetical protein
MVLPDKRRLQKQVPQKSQDTEDLGYLTKSGKFKGGRAAENNVFSNLNRWKYLSLFGGGGVTALHSFRISSKKLEMLPR